MTGQTIETKIEKLVYLYPTIQESQKIPKSEYDAIYELFNSVGKDPKEFYTPDNKGRIKIQDNRIIYLDAGEIGLNSVPKSIGDLKNLEGLYLYNNQLNSVSESIVNLKNLKELYLGYNQIKSVPESIGDLKNLEGLYLGYNQIKSVPESIGDLKNLEGLYLGY